MNKVKAHNTTYAYLYNGYLYLHSQKEMLSGDVDIFYNEFKNSIELSKPRQGVGAEYGAQLLNVTKETVTKRIRIPELYTHLIQIGKMGNVGATCKKAVIFADGIVHVFLDSKIGEANA